MYNLQLNIDFAKPHKAARPPTWRGKSPTTTKTNLRLENIEHAVHGRCRR